jgi:tetratricopeptide (TPR) repeat protein
MNRTATRRKLTWVLLAFLGVLPAGCNMDRGTSPTEQAQVYYQRGDYARAQTAAARAATTAGGVQRDLAHYMAGMSAYRLGNYSTAERYLRVAAASRDDAMAADARSTLGLIYSGRGRYADAAEALLGSAKLQTGEDRAQAYFYAGIAQQKLGRWPQARTSLLLARRSTRDAGLAGRIDQQLAVTGYTIQVGAFSRRANADKAASRYAVKAASAKLGPVHVTPTTRADGLAVNLVQVGRFATFKAASEARSRLGDLGALIVPLQR